MKYANSERKECMNTGNTRGVLSMPGTGLLDAKETANNDGDVLRKKYGNPVYFLGCDFYRLNPKYEADVSLIFLNLVRDGKLPGFRIFGLPSKMMFDGFFDYNLNLDEHTIFSTSNPLGVKGIKGDSINWQGHWLEYKKSSDLLITDCNLEKGSPSKKWFELCNLLVCYNVDDGIDNFTLQEVNENNYQERTYYGVTHLIKKENNSHVIQVISLKTLLKQLQK